MPWTVEQIELLKQIYPDLPTVEVAARCAHSLGSTYRHASKLGLKKSAAFLASPDSGRIEHHLYRGEKSRFAKGHAPQNKGLRRPGWHRGRMRETQFKKGRRPHTWHPIGSERVSKDGIVQVKVTDGVKPAYRNWKSKHQFLWEQANGPLPDGHLVIFKNGDNRDFALTNLELVTHREQMRRNSVHRYPRELVQVMQLRGALNRQINKRSPPPKPRIGRPPKKRTTEQPA